MRIPLSVDISPIYIADKLSSGLAENNLHDIFYDQSVDKLALLGSHASLMPHAIPLLYGMLGRNWFKVLLYVRNEETDKFQLDRILDLSKVYYVSKDFKQDHSGSKVVNTCYKTVNIPLSAILYDPENDLVLNIDNHPGKCYIVKKFAKRANIYSRIPVFTFDQQTKRIKSIGGIGKIPKRVIAYFKHAYI